MKLVNRLEDDERLDALLDELERRAPGVDPPDDADNRSDTGSVTSHLGKDLRGIRQALGGLEAKLAASGHKNPGKAPPASGPKAAGGSKKRPPTKSAPPIRRPR
jgi:hypothetical protein